MPSHENTVFVFKRLEKEGKLVGYLCGVPVTLFERTASRSHEMKELTVIDVQTRVWNREAVYTARLTNEEEKGSSVFEVGAPLVLVLKTEQDDKDWTNLSSLPAQEPSEELGSPSVFASLFR
jgi:hypothetical protein